jgi:hypothetical protein
VRTVVVADQVDVQAARDVLVDPLEEFQELLVPVATVQLADHGAVGDVEGGKQAGHTVPGVVMGAPLGMPGITGSTGWDRSRARTWDFSSAQSATAFSGGL